MGRDHRKDALCLPRELQLEGGACCARVRRLCSLQDEESHPIDSGTRPILSAARTGRFITVPTFRTYGQEDGTKPDTAAVLRAAGEGIPDTRPGALPQDAEDHGGLPCQCPAEEGPCCE